MRSRDLSDARDALDVQLVKSHMEMMKHMTEHAETANLLWAVTARKKDGMAAYFDRKLECVGSVKKSQFMENTVHSLERALLLTYNAEAVDTRAEPLNIPPQFLNAEILEPPIQLDQENVQQDDSDDDYLVCGM